jgi:hypothetical protein
LILIYEKMGKEIHLITGTSITYGEILTMEQDPLLCPNDQCKSKQVIISHDTNLSGFCSRYSQLIGYGLLGFAALIGMPALNEQGVLKWVLAMWAILGSLALFFLWLGSNPVSISENHFICQQCGYCWIDKKIDNS